MIKNLLLIFLFLILCSCAIKSRQDQSQLRSLVSQNQLKEALAFLETSELKKDKKNELLYLMEKGRILFRQNLYKEAADIFVEANELVDKLYTKSIRQEIAAGFLSDNSKNYYGSIFERSMLYYYQSMAYLRLSEASVGKKDKRSYLFKSRASLLAWDSFFKEINRKTGLKTLYRGSLVGKILAASVHEKIGTKSEKNIALQLYKDSAEILKTQGLTYKNFNNKSSEYIESVKSNKSKKIKNTQTQHTQAYKKLQNFIHYKILSLTKLLRSSQLKRMTKLYKPSASVLKKLKERSGNITILVERGNINPIKPKMFSYTIKSAVDSIKNPTTKALVNGIGVPVLTYFAMGPLGLGVPTRSGNAVFYTGHNIGNTITKEAGIEFEMPSVEIASPYKNSSIEIYSSDGKTKIKQSELTLYGALNDIASLSASERAENSYKKVGTKIAIKHIVAILAAYQTYKKIKESSGEFFAKAAAFTQYVLSAKVIAQTEKADTRHWTTLPQALLTSDLYLKPGSYLVKVNKEGSGLKDLGTIDVTKGNRQVFTFSLN